MISHEDLIPQKHYCENLKTCQLTTDARSEVHTAVLLGSHIFCAATPCHGLSGSQHVRGSMSLKKSQESLTQNATLYHRRLES
jgi:hypothetical protein